MLKSDKPTLWGRWFPVIEAADIWAHTLTADDLTSDDFHQADLRHHCYELHIAATHLAWFVQTGDAANLNKLAVVVEEILARGPSLTRRSPVP